MYIHTHQVVSKTTTTTTTTTTKLFDPRLPLCVNSCQTSAVDMSDVERASGAARRRRERRLRSWLKHERQTVRMLSTVSAEVEGGVGGKARDARRPTGTEHGKDQGGHVLHVED